ncbi:MAG: phage holin family protein [Candidatus Nealsonbacteria bacterium]|nr:phage holin family protein [Candidatus Nealsonbacteria bacterium]
MSEPRRSATAALRDEINSLAADVKESAVLRWELAQFELRSAATQIKRLAIGLAAAGVLLLCCVPILTIALAAWLAERTIISFAGWSAILGVAFLVAGAAGGYVAWRRFRRRFIGMEETLEELHEDLLWLREWTGRREES